MQILYLIPQILSSSLYYGLLLLLVTHLFTTLISKTQKPIQINNNTVVVIAGACMGIGRQMALQIARKYKPTLLILDLREQLFPEMELLLRELGCQPLFKKVNLGEEKEVQRVLEEIKSQYEKIGLLIYNAGIVIPKRGLLTSVDEHHLVMNVNYFTPVRFIQALEKQLTGGHVAVVASMVAIILGGINYTSYGASKKAIFHYLTSLRQQFKRDGKDIGISIACPYAINTTMFKGFKTYMDLLLPILNEKYVGERLVRQFIKRQEVIYVYQYMSVVFKIVQFFPSQITDWMQTFFDKSNFQPIQDKHKKQGQKGTNEKKGD